MHHMIPKGPLPQVRLQYFRVDDVERVQMGQTNSNYDELASLLVVDSFFAVRSEPNNDEGVP